MSKCNKLCEQCGIKKVSAPHVILCRSCYDSERKVETLFNTPCPICKVNLIKNYKAKSCIKCKGKCRPKVINPKTVCGCGGKKSDTSPICIKCSIEKRKKHNKEKREAAFNNLKDCPSCGINKIRKPNGKQCGECYIKFLSIGGENAINWRGGKERYKCVDCGGLCTKGRERCRECFLKLRTKPVFYCKSCGEQLPNKTPSILKIHKPSGVCGKCMKGEFHHAYNPNKTQAQRLKDRHTNENYEWRKGIFSSDNWECQCCGYTGRGLNAHHIFNYAKYENARLDEDNGITLCSDCHKSFHKIYGKTNNDLSQFLHFLNNQHAAV